MTTIEREGNIFKMTTIRLGKSITPLIISAMLLGAFNAIVYKMSTVNFGRYIIPFLLILFVVIFLLGCAVLFLLFGLAAIVPKTFILDEDGIWSKVFRNISLLCTWEEMTDVRYTSYTGDRYGRRTPYSSFNRRTYRMIEIKTSRRVKGPQPVPGRDPYMLPSEARDRRTLYWVYITDVDLSPSDLRVLYNEIRSQWMNRGIRYQIPDIRPAPYQIKRAEAS